MPASISAPASTRSSASRDFGAPALGAVIVNREQNVTIINNTTNITNITVNNSTVYTGGPSYAKITAALSARPIPTLKLVRQSDTSLIRPQGGKILSHQQGNQLVVLAPQDHRPRRRQDSRPAKVAKTLPASKRTTAGMASRTPQQRAEAPEQDSKPRRGSEPTLPPNRSTPKTSKLVNEKAQRRASKTLASGPAATPQSPARAGRKSSRRLPR